MPEERPDRRDFLTALGLGSVAASGTGCIAPTGPGADAGAPRDLIRADYLFDPGLNYVQTASLGPCPRHVVEATLRAWFELESNPTPRACSGVTLATAEAVRDEIVITRSTTDGMNAVAQGLDGSPGDRLFTSDQEHERGLSGWQHVARRYGEDRLPAPGARARHSPSTRSSARSGPVAEGGEARDGTTYPEPVETCDACVRPALRGDAHPPCCSPASTRARFWRAFRFPGSSSSERR